MALYSVWNWDRNNWEIYRDARPVSVGVDAKAPKPSNVSALGADPDTQMNPLPSDAKFMGYDHMCRGEVRVANSSVLSGLGLDVPDVSDLKKYAIGAALGFGAFALYRSLR